MNRPSLKSRPQWTVAVPREETLVVREKFRKVSGVGSQSVLTPDQHLLEPGSTRSSAQPKKTYKTHQPAMEMIIPSLQCPSHAVHGRLHYPTSETGTAGRRGNARCRPARSRAQQAEYTRNATVGHPQKKQAVKRMERARSMLQLGRLDRRMVCACEGAAIDMSQMLAEVLRTRSEEGRERQAQKRCDDDRHP